MSQASAEAGAKAAFQYVPRYNNPYATTQDRADWFCGYDWHKAGRPDPTDLEAANDKS